MSYIVRRPPSTNSIIGDKMDLAFEYFCYRCASFLHPFNAVVPISRFFTLFLMRMRSPEHIAVFSIGSSSTCLAPVASSIVLSISTEIALALSRTVFNLTNSFRTLGSSIYTQLFPSPSIVMFSFQVSAITMMWVDAFTCSGGGACSHI